MLDRMMDVLERLKSADHIAVMDDFLSIVIQSPNHDIKRWRFSLRHTKKNDNALLIVEDAFLQQIAIFASEDELLGFVPDTIMEVINEALSVGIIDSGF